MELCRNWRAKNRDKANAANARRRTSRLKATPPWVNFEELFVYYQLAASATELLGEKHHVDHIIPLQGKTVCGLHVPWTLQVIPAKQNLSKANKLLDV